MMALAFAKAAATFEPHARMVKLNTELEGEVAGRYGIRSIPTMIVFNNGQEVARQSGAMNAQAIINWCGRQRAEQPPGLQFYYTNNPRLMVSTWSSSAYFRRS